MEEHTGERRTQAGDDVVPERTRRHVEVLKYQNVDDDLVCASSFSSLTLVRVWLCASTRGHRHETKTAACGRRGARRSDKLAISGSVILRRRIRLFFWRELHTTRQALF